MSSPTTFLVQPQYSSQERSRCLKSIGEDRRFGVWEWENVQRKEYVSGVGQVGSSPRNLAPGLSDEVLISNSL